MKNIRYAIATALTGALMVAGCTAVTASSAATASGTSRAGAGEPAVPPALTHITAWSIDTDNPVLASIVSGAIGDYGPAEEVSPGGTGVAAHGGDLELKLAHGTFGLNVAGIEAKFTEGTSHEPIFPRTCSTYVSVSGNVPIVPGSGTGAYQGIAGTFAMTLTVNEVHNSPCTSSLNLLRQVVVLSGAGMITRR